MTDPRAALAALLARLGASAFLGAGGRVQVRRRAWLGLSERDRALLMEHREDVRRLLVGEALDTSPDAAYGVSSRRSQAAIVNDDGANRPTDKGRVASVSPGDGVSGDGDGTERESSGSDPVGTTTTAAPPPHRPRPTSKVISTPGYKSAGGTPPPRYQRSPSGRAYIDVQSFDTWSRRAKSEARITTALQRDARRAWRHFLAGRLRRAASLEEQLEWGRR